MRQNFNKKVCLIVDCLGSGGAERMAARLSIKLNEGNYNVTIISLRDDISYGFQGILYNLGKNEPRFKLIKQLYKLFHFKKTYREIDADFYIDFRMRNRFIMEWLLHKFVFNMERMIFTIHSYNIFYHMPKSKFFYLEYSCSKALVGVSRAISEKLLQVYNFKNLISISNFYNQSIKAKAPEIPEPFNSLPFVLAVGRLDNDIKQFDKLVLAYKDSVLMGIGVSLVILGEGKDRMVLENLINDYKLTNYVKLLGFRDNVYGFMKAAKLVLLTSKFEGFPNVILESLAIGTPVISFDCKSGPSEMIVDGVNGILVENQNFKAFKEAINKMAIDRHFYEYCKLNTSDSVSNFSEEKVLTKWIELIES